MDTNNAPNVRVRGAIVIISKCPIPGASKTRLAASSNKGLASEHCHLIAKAMLCDVIRHISLCPYFENCHELLKIIMYAPGTSEGKLIMDGVLDECFSFSDANESNGEMGSLSQLKREEWILFPMLSSSTKEAMRSSDLGVCLVDALENVRQHQQSKGISGGVVFLGMDCPEIPILEVANALKYSESGEALLCPADDGGYGMLGIPPGVDASRVFLGIRWSDKLTALSQLKALSDCGICTIIGQVMRDIDEFSELIDLATRLCDIKNSHVIHNSEIESALSMSGDALSLYSARGLHGQLKSYFCSCGITWKCMNDIGLVIKDDRGIFSVRRVRSL